MVNTIPAGSVYWCRGRFDSSDQCDAHIAVVSKSAFVVEKTKGEEMNDRRWMDDRSSTEHRCTATAAIRCMQEGEEGYNAQLTATPTAARRRCSGPLLIAALNLLH